MALSRQGRSSVRQLLKCGRYLLRGWREGYCRRLNLHCMLTDNYERSVDNYKLILIQNENPNLNYEQIVEVG